MKYGGVAHLFAARFFNKRFYLKLIDAPLNSS